MQCRGPWQGRSAVTNDLRESELSWEDETAADEDSQQYIIIITSIFLKWPKQQTPPQGPLQSQSSKQAGSDSVVAATKQICL